MSLKNIEIQTSYDTKVINSEPERDPILFYRNVFEHSIRADFHLGYFSTNAIINIAASFASFIKKGGRVRFITNEFLSEKDVELINQEDIIDHSDVKKITETIQDAEELEKTFKKVNQHFFNCLKYLIEKKQIDIIPVLCKDYNEKPNGMSHYKIAFFYDETDNWIYSSGSANFSFGGMVKNGEKIETEKSWILNKKIGDPELQDSLNKRLNDCIKEQERIEKIILGSEPNFVKAATDQIQKVVRKQGKSLEISQLIHDEKEIQNCIIKQYNSNRSHIFKNYPEIEKLKQQPRFPFDKPRRYQALAYTKWEENNYNGLFAMATGTGKTITSLNCVLNEYKKTGKYKVIIAVPTTALVDQWAGECDGENKFNFKNIITSSQNKYKKRLRDFLLTDMDFIFITTYATISTGGLDQIFNVYKSALENFIFIADECHNIGSKKLFKKIPNMFKKRIGLSATPERVYDQDGSKNLFNYFNAQAPCFTYSLSMKTAIEGQQNPKIEPVLSQFHYYPKFTTLQTNELDKYIKITKQIMPLLNSKTKKDNDRKNKLLIDRKRIINKAKNKEVLLKKIIQDIQSNKKLPEFKYAFIYAPEGYEDTDFEQDISSTKIATEHTKIIDKYCEILGEDLELNVQTFLGNTKHRKSILKDYKNGKLDCLIAIKCLDEGVDVPRTQYGIFCSSTGNPRQYVQRRGRVIRAHNEKKISYIYDMIVKPNLKRSSIVDEKYIQYERAIFKKEIIRSINFIALARNRSMLISSEFNDLCEEYDINLAKEINNERKKYDNCQDN